MYARLKTLAAARQRSLSVEVISLPEQAITNEEWQQQQQMLLAGIQLRRFVPPLAQSIVLPSCARTVAGKPGAVRRVFDAGSDRQALDIALRHSITAYDACYVALASRLGKSFITTGERLARPVAGTPH